MSYCINPSCPQPNDPANTNNRICRHCGSQLLLKGRYQVMRLLSDHSGFGKVYEAYCGATPKILKVLQPRHNHNLRVIKLFKQEAAVLSKLNHPGIPKVEPDGYFQFFPRNSTEPVHCIIMEKIDGPNLRQWMRQQGNHPIAEQQALRWLKQLAEILHLVHQKNYFHRDIKPENIMLRSSGQLVLIDFGTARELTYTYFAEVGGEGSVTKISSAGYTPPEQEKGHAVPQSDFYALGRTFVYLLTSKQATDQDIYEPLTDKLNWRHYTSDISTQLADFIDKMMAPTAAARPKNTQEVLNEIARISRGLPQHQLLNNSSEATILQGCTTQTMSEDVREKQRVVKTQKWLIGGAVAVVVGLGVYGIGQVYPFKQENISIVKTLEGHDGYVNYLNISPDGKRLISSSADKTIKIWDLFTDKPVRTLIRHSKHIDYFAISSDLTKIATVGGDNTIKIWDLNTGQEINTLTSHSSFVNAVAISYDSQILVSASADKTIKIWDLATGREIKTLKGHSGAVNHLIISHDQQLLASASADKTIKIWDLNTGKDIKTLRGHSSFVNYLAISNDDQLLASASADKNIKVWDLATKKEIATLKGHSSWVKPIVISPDGKTLFSGGAENKIRIWDLTTKKEIDTLKGHSSYINSLTISPDGKTLVSASADQTIKIWRLAK
ncbi:MAG: protein kinase [Symploca sp. SIO3C6]|uniref:Protein kinase n=1 Tax=Symploca sp. SIO1C4 TaxID=2607765 RepID=A0A6B3NDH7_9CYAN|nr:protein kinase [Symploca sp. SIO3C6]NER29653.1 protein kinase [Symploca sp. SIO1C4]NET03804.1 protein kinase [Symploca sp. SIO2B6]